VSGVLAGIVRFEWRYGTRQVAFAAVAVLFAAMGFALVATGYGPAEVNVNSPFAAMQATGLLSLPAIFVLTVFCTGAVQRDTEHRMAEIVFGTPVGKTRYLLGRFGGALLVSATAFSASTLGMLLAPLVTVVDPERLGRTDVAAYLWALLVMGLPNLLIAGTIVFAVAALTRSTLASYVGGVFVYALYFVCAVLVHSPLLAGGAPVSAEALARAALIDPFGISALFEQTRYWTPEMRDTRLLSLSGRFLLNRVLWMAVSAAILAVVHRRFALRVATGAKTKMRTRKDADDAPASVAVYRPVAVSGRGARWRALASATRVQLAHVLRSKPFLALMALWACVAWANFAGGTESAEYATRLYPTTGILLGIARSPLSGLGTIVLIYFSAELAWRDRSAHLAEILDATPTDSAVFYLARLAALALTAIVMTAATLIVAVAFQLSRGYVHPEPGQLAAFLVSAGLPLVLFAVAALLAQTLSPNRYVAMMAALLLAIVAQQGPAIGLEHHLLRFAAGPQAAHSDMAGGGQVADSFRWMMLYWTAFAALLAFATVGAWRRGTVAPLGRRLASVPRRLGRRGMAGAAACLLLFLATGAFVFRGTNVVNAYETGEDAAEWRAGYERAYRRIADAPQPAITSIRADVDLYPRERRFDVRGTFGLENRTSRAVDTVWVGLPQELARADVSVAGADAVVRDERFGMRGFRMRRPLAPGARAEMSYRISVAERGIRTSGFDLSIADNGSFVTHLRAFSTLGYRRGYELSDPAERRRHHLQPREELPASGLAEAMDDEAGDRATFAATVSTDADQTAVAPGELRATWTRGGRRYFRYASEGPINRQAAFASARYSVRREMHGGVSVEVYFHPGHAQNVERMMRAATVSLDDFGRAFGPYPHRSLRIVEVPPYWGFGAFAMPGVIWVTEDRGFLTDARDTTALDLVTRRVAHEVGHQWWAQQVNPGAGPGSTFVTESLAKYSEQMVLRHLRGEGQVARLREFDLQRYLLGRAQQKEPEHPLAAAEGEPYLYYGKGAIVMAAIRDAMGEPAMNRALARFVREHAYPRPSPPSEDLIATLQAEAPPEARPLIGQWTREVVTYDLAVTSATYQRLPDGRYLVTARIRASKTARRGPADVPLPMDEMLDIAAYAAGSSIPNAPPLYLAKHRIRGPGTEVSFVVMGKPVTVMIDPRNLRVELDRAENARDPVSWSGRATR
jgi:ABC-type transport system involved in multi-copper enzyme maturation permease subunit